MNFNTLCKVAPFVIGNVTKDINGESHGYPMMIRGAHGAGKTDTVQQIAKCYHDFYEIEGDFRDYYVERHASQMDVGDVIGLPKQQEDRTVFLLTDFLREACEKPMFIFLDELDRASTEVRQQFFQVAASREINGNHLHPGTKLVAAGNGSPTIAHMYDTYTMGPAEMDRWWVVDVEPTVEDWLTWASGKFSDVCEEIQNTLATIDSNRVKELKTPIHDFIVGYISEHSEWLESNPKDFVKGIVQPTRRSWQRFNDCLVSGDLLFNQENNGLIYFLGVGFLGESCSADFRDYHKKNGKRLGIEDVLIGKKETFKLLESFDISEHNEIVRQMKSKSVFKVELAKKQAKNLSKYFEMLPAELQVRTWGILGEECEDEKNIVKLYLTEMSNGQSFGEYFAEVFESNEDLILEEINKNNEE